MANIRSVNMLIQDYERHLSQLDELRDLLQQRLTAAKAGLASPADAQPPVALTLLDTGSGSTSKRTRARTRRRITELEVAIERMDRGLFGVCRRCGCFIDLDHLRRSPHRQECDACRTGHRPTAAA
ncbi:hypothetical protein ABZ297_39805 [Nonomuraea sp. NPDC005983]|uniref:hypothetical protein n=1 Tax=Nonomuraea sp. NPDC005983 TaxID=3155595 RepID=UPI0033AD9E2E